MQEKKYSNNIGSFPKEKEKSKLRRKGYIKFAARLRARGLSASHNTRRRSVTDPVAAMVEPMLVG